MPSSSVLKLSLMAVALPVVLSLPHHQKRSPSLEGLKVVQGNDDGWWESSTRQMFQQMTDAGIDVILSAPLKNQSGKGSHDAPPKTPDTPGEYNSAPAGAPAIGHEPTNPRINYVNSYPVTAVKYGLDTLSEKFWGTGAKPDYVVAGPNVGPNIGLITLVSGTIGVANEGALAGIPSIAFSGAPNNPKSYLDLTPGDSSHIYADLSLRILEAVVASNAIPQHHFLSVNFGKPTEECPTADDFKIVFTKIHGLWFGTPCEDGTPSRAESLVQQHDCYATISPVTAHKTSPLPGTQARIYNALRQKLDMVCFHGKHSPAANLEGIKDAAEGVFAEP